MHDAGACVEERESVFTIEQHHDFLLLSLSLWPGLLWVDMSNFLADDRRHQTFLPLKKWIKSSTFVEPLNV